MSNPLSDEPEIPHNTLAVIVHSPRVSTCSQLLKQSPRYVGSRGIKPDSVIGVSK